MQTNPLLVKLVLPEEETSTTAARAALKRVHINIFDLVSERFANEGCVCSVSTPHAPSRLEPLRGQSADIQRRPSQPSAGDAPTQSSGHRASLSCTSMQGLRACSLHTVCGPRPRAAVPAHSSY